MEEKTKFRVAAMMTAVIGVAYFLACATPLPKPLAIKPVWVDEIPANQTYRSDAVAPVDRILSFETGDLYGYFDTKGGVVASGTRSYGVSVTDSGYVRWDEKPASVSFVDPRGAVQFTTTMQGYPFMDGHRRFMVSANQSTITEFDNTGGLLWAYDFPSIVTAFSSNDDIAVFGTLDGRIIALDRKGREVLSFAPGGSRIPCIYGCAISPDGRTIAATAGLDRQRIVVLEKREEAYRVTWHSWMESEFRRPVAMSFTEDGRELVFETQGGIGVYDVASRKERLLSARDPLSLGAAVPGRSLLVALDHPSSAAVVIASYAGHVFFRLPFAADIASLRAEGDSLFLGVRRAAASSLLRLDFVEE